MIAGPAPRVGEHSRDVLIELGYDERAISKMVEDKAVRLAG
jgi:crotonobetainyl-CoA:carnitine CoA-transferase CaiB-like acyl-CoA transferase